MRKIHNVLSLIFLAGVVLQAPAEVTVSDTEKSFSVRTSAGSAPGLDDGEMLGLNFPIDADTGYQIEVLAVKHFWSKSVPSLGGLLGGVSGAIAGAIGYYANAYKNLEHIRLAKAMAHGARGGIVNLAKGDNLSAGFLSGLSGSYFEGSLIAASLAGGTVSVLGGGKFESGAITGAVISIIASLAKWHGEYRKRHNDAYWRSKGIS